MTHIPEGLDYINKPKDYYQNDRPEMLKYLPDEVGIILDVGCSNGDFGSSLKRIKNAEVWGIEPMNKYATEAEGKLDNLINSSVEAAIDELPNNYFDVIFFNDVLEHLLDPYTVLEKIKPKLKENGKVISSIPNIRYFRTFFKLLFDGEWDYQDEGILDRTHVRFFTKKSILKMYNSAGYVVERHEGINASKSLKQLLINIPLLFKAGDMKYMQFVTVAHKK